MSDYKVDQFLTVKPASPHIVALPLNLMEDAVQMAIEAHARGKPVPQIGKVPAPKK